MSPPSRSLLLIGHFAVSIIWGKSDVQAQADTDPMRYEVRLEYGRPDPWVDHKRFNHALFISGRLPYNDRLAAQSEVSLVFTEDFGQNSDTRFGSIFIGGEFTAEPNTIRFGVRLPVESNPVPNCFCLSDLTVDDQRLAAFRPEVGSVMVLLSRSPFEEGTIGVVAGVGAVFLFGNLYETDSRTWIRTDVEFILRGTQMTASLGLSSALPVPYLEENTEIDDWRFQPMASIHLNNDRVLPGVFVRHPHLVSSTGWIFGAEIRFLFF